MIRAGNQVSSGEQVFRSQLQKALFQPSMNFKFPQRFILIEQSRVILLLIWNLAFYNHCQDLRVREVEHHARKILRPYSSVVIFSMARANNRKITLARFVVNVNGFSTFVPGAGSTHGFSRVIQSSQRSIPCS